MLKALLQRLLNTRTTREEAGQCSRPAWGADPILLSGNDVESDWGLAYSGTMPIDGLLVIDFTGTESTSLVACPTSMAQVPWAMGVGRSSMPVAKGTYVNIYGNHVKGVELRLYPLAASL